MLCKLMDIPIIWPWLLSNIMPQALLRQSKNGHAGLYPVSRKALCCGYD